MHEEGNPGADSLTMREADAGKGLENTGLTGRLVADSNNCRELDTFLQDLLSDEVCQLRQGAVKFVHCRSIFTCGGKMPGSGSFGTPKGILSLDMDDYEASDGINLRTLQFPVQ
ncbi:hypothetical protein NE237_012123 [Protea cynaroides]|uniref:Uncharacterized protein n=1 Tax=Protea cynaroides TaxID=273540 RepID=A0A9Q0JYJ0_9MAGN|nr:hypothetical protein NE237_012123 [Protea cynaroides]